MDKVIYRAIFQNTNRIMTANPVSKKSHKERVAMRQMLRDSGLVDKNADNDTCDVWLTRHGYLHIAGYKPPKDRVKKLRRNLGLGRTHDYFSGPEVD